MVTQRLLIVAVSPVFGRPCMKGVMVIQRLSIVAVSPVFGRHAVLEKFPTPSDQTESDKKSER
jgi:hypothetical protein